MEEDGKESGAEAVKEIFAWKNLEKQFRVNSKF